MSAHAAAAAEQGRSGQSRGELDYTKGCPARAGQKWWGLHANEESPPALAHRHDLLSPPSPCGDCVHMHSNLSWMQQSLKQNAWERCRRYSWRRSAHGDAWRATPMSNVKVDATLLACNLVVCMGSLSSPTHARHPHTPWGPSACHGGGTACRQLLIPANCFGQCSGRLPSTDLLGRGRGGGSVRTRAAADRCCDLQRVHASFASRVTAAGDSHASRYREVHTCFLLHSSSVLCAIRLQRCAYHSHYQRWSCPLSIPRVERAPALYGVQVDSTSAAGPVARSKGCS